jgi:hypothetical protein
LHIGYVLTVAGREVVVAYTTSQPWPAAMPLPAGARLIDAEEAARLNQSRAFMIRVDVLARLPLVATWFPDIDGLNQGVIAFAPPLLRRELTLLTTNLVRRKRELLDFRGP